MTDLEHLKYPIGKFSLPEKFEKPELDLAIENIQKFSERMVEAVSGLKDKQLDTPYRPDGWTIRQVVHHCADSHTNCLTRFKLALTEDTPTIKPYKEDKWAELADSKKLALDSSIKIIEGIHLRWNVLLNSMTSEDFDKTFLHPEHNSEMSLKDATALYSWHCNHHLSHITHLKERKGW